MNTPWKREAREILTFLQNGVDFWIYGPKNCAEGSSVSDNFLFILKMKIFFKMKTF